MKGIIKIAFAAAMVANVAASHDHQRLHRLRHAKRHDNSAVEKRNLVLATEIVEGPTLTKYVDSEGNEIEPEAAKKGIEDGEWAVLGETEPTFVPPPVVYSTSVSPPSSTMGALFVEKESSSEPAPAAPTKVAPPPVSGGSGLDRDFPSGEIDCSHFPSDYGPIPIEWEGTGGWTTLMKVGAWIPNVMFNNIKVGIPGENCVKGDLCSYACPPGYQKTQWPVNEQGATGQSVGGLFCNNQGKLVLTRPSHTKLCEKGAGGIFIRNELDEVAALCRTDYPGSESMNVPLLTTPGGTFPVCNPKSSGYYFWDEKPTTAQYYLNPKGLGLEDACTWVSKTNPDSAGNWAPVNIGTGMDNFGITYLSIFPNQPTTTAILDYDVEIVGDVNGECWMRNGVYAKTNGCTVCFADSEYMMNWKLTVNTIGRC